MPPRAAKEETCVAMQGRADKLPEGQTGHRPVSTTLSCAMNACVFQD